MLLKSVKIDGLRGYAQPVQLLCAQPDGKAGSGLTVIVGPNNSGKSTLIETFRLRRGWGSPSFNVGMRNRLNDFVRIEFVFDSHTEIIRSVRAGSSEAIVEGQDLSSAPVIMFRLEGTFLPPLVEVRHLRAMPS